MPSISLPNITNHDDATVVEACWKKGLPRAKCEVFLTFDSWVGVLSRFSTSEGAQPFVFLAALQQLGGE